MEELLREAAKKVNEEFSVGLSGKCEPGWQEITSLEKCQRAAEILSLSFRVKRENTSAITRCIATSNSMSEGRGNTTIEKPICRSVSTNIGGTTEAAAFSTGVPLKRTKRQVYNTRTFTCSDWVQNRAYWVWEHEVPSTCESE